MATDTAAAATYLNTSVLNDPEPDGSPHEPDMNDNKSVRVASDGSPLSYDAVFPPLPARSGQILPPTDMTYSASLSSAPSKQSSRITIAFKVPMEERRQSWAATPGLTPADKQWRACSDKVRGLNVDIEYTETKDQCLQVFIHGKQQDCLEAKKRLVDTLQVVNSCQLHIPREHHRFILGKKGANLREIEMSTSTKIEVPREQENSDIIKISGSREGIEKARHELLVISDTQSKLASERIAVDKIWHPFIIGPYGQTLGVLRDQTNAKINVPPPAVMSDEIVVAGEKDSVHKAVTEIKRMVSELKKTCQTVAVEIAKSQHKYIIGPKGAGLSEILEAARVSVEVPPNDTDAQTITLRGPAEALGSALTLVYQKAKSVVVDTVDCPSWLHRFVIGKKGATLQKITEGKQRVHIDFLEAGNKIQVEGPQEEVDEVVDQLSAITADLMSTMSRAEVPIDPRFHKHIIGKNGSNVNRLKKETMCFIRIPDENDWNVVIEGPPDGVNSVKEEILQMVSKIENEKSKDLIIEQKYHRLLIGHQGSRIKDLRDQFQQVQIVFPDPSKNSEIIQVRGPRAEVEPASKLLLKMYRELMESNYSQEVRIFKKFHKNVIGKSGANIRRIREETETKIELPDSGSDSDIIKITGRKKNVEDAVNQIETIQRQLANVTESQVNIPHRLHTKLIGGKGRLVRALEEEMGGVQIRFPPPDSTSDTVTVRGPKPDVERAVKQLEELAQQRLEQLYQESIYAKPEFHKFLIGRRGDKIDKLRKQTGARVVFPEPEREGSSDPNNPKEREEIQIIGTTEAVAAARKELEAQIRDLENIIEDTVDVDTKWHRHFLQRRGAELELIARQFGGVSVSFPKVSSNDTKVRVKGPQKCVTGAIARIQEIVEDLASRVTIQVIIPHTHHRALIGKKGDSVQEICSDFQVSIKFPERTTSSPPPSVNMNGHAPVNGDAAGSISSETTSESGNGDNEISGINPAQNIIQVTGKKENCEAARDALMALVPLVMEINLPNDYHRLLIGQNGQSLRDVMNKYRVNIVVPDRTKKLDTITLRGTQSCIDAAREHINELIKQWDLEKEDREARNFVLSAEVPRQYHREIIGVRGATIKQIREAHSVIINMPDPKDESDVITIRGYREKAEAAKADILKRVAKLETYVREEVCIPPDVHSRLIGNRGMNLRKMQEEYNVQITFPGREASGEDAERVFVYGPKEGVDDCCNNLIIEANDMMNEIREREQINQLTVAPSTRSIEEKRRNEQKRNARGEGFVVMNAPWHSQTAPDTTSTADFPSIGSGAGTNGNAVPFSGRWGKK